jgi:hypothetical protein
MSLEDNQRDELGLEDDLGKMIRQSLETRAGRAIPPARGRELLMAAARALPVDDGNHRSFVRDEYRWHPPQRRDQSHTDHDLLSGLIHARESVRRMSL